VPVRYREAELAVESAEAVFEPPAGPWVMVVEDDPATRMLYEKYLTGSGFAVVTSPSLAQARDRMASHAAAAIILDMGLPGEEEKTWRWLADLKGRRGGPPVIVASASGEERKARSLGADAYLPKPVDRETLLAALAQFAPLGPSPVALIIDDDEAARYVIRRSVREPMQFEEASDGASGLAAAARLAPGVIFLDLAMPGMTGDEVLERLAADPRTSAIPVIVVTSQEMEPTRDRRIRTRARAILQKRDLCVETVSATLEAIRAGS
jgi:CheY-like chemotaxis protein